MSETGGGGGYIRLHRQILKWEWYGNSNTFRLFLHCLLKANYADGRFEGRDIKRGSFVTSLDKLAHEIGQSVRQVRVSLDHLILTGELTSQSFNRYRVITVVKYDEYQSNDKQNDRQMTSERQAYDKQMTSKWQQYKNNNKNNNNNKEQENNIKPLKRFVPPTLEEIEEYCWERKNHVSPSQFFDYYQSVGWLVGKGKPMKDWKAAVRRWERDERTERDYQNGMRGLPI